MTQQQVLLIGIIIAFVGGYLVGSERNNNNNPVVASSPINYDPGRATCNDALRESQAATDRCWKTVVDTLTVKVNPPVPKGKTAHE